MFTSTVYEFVAAGIASACLLLLLVRGSLFTGAVVSNLKRGKVWPPRRKRIVILTFAALVVQVSRATC